MLVLQVRAPKSRSAKGSSCQTVDEGVSRIAAAIGDLSRARMLCCLMDGHARTATELAITSEISPSTASVHLGRLADEKLVRMVRQGKHRYYALNGPDVAQAMENLSVLSGASHNKFIPNTPHRLRSARTCYDHIAGALGVALHDRTLKFNWLTADPSRDQVYVLTPQGQQGFGELGIDLANAKTSRRRFAFGCIDWSERRPHIGGAVGAALLTFALRHKWVAPDLDSRALTVTQRGRREVQKYFGIALNG
ncbi:MAG TPA: helix-turn-helix transcriptional regulator [Bryobacteraceae bacterium]|jgi:DNA-binding transcriptional ArsR family regulator|nr:helix-turn-helix transcriptional regulator [Bryobacteraceae bacterium]